MSNVKKQAKTASKNNPSARGAKLKSYYLNEEISPVMINVYRGKSYMGGLFTKTKKLILDSEGSPVRWTAIAKIRK